MLDDERDPSANESESENGWLAKIVEFVLDVGELIVNLF